MPKSEKVLSNPKVSTAGLDEVPKLKLEEWKNGWKTDAEKLVVESFPSKVLEIDAVICSAKFQLKRLPEFQVDINVPIPDSKVALENCSTVNKKRKLDDMDDVAMEGTKVVAFVNGVVPSNKHIMELINVVKPIVREVVESVNKLKMWILFLIPRIEDGNNFGVSIQEDTLAEVRTVESEAASFLDQISRYLLTRGKIVTKIAKYPHVEDYRRAIEDLDEKEFLNLRLVLMEVRNHYSTLHDMIMKNFEKIKKPRNSNAEHLY